MGDTDVAFRRLVRWSPQPLLQLVFSGHALEPLGSVDASVDRSRRLTTDNLFRVRDGDRIAAIHVEIEREWRGTIPPRLFDYASAAATETRLPVSSMVLLLERGGKPPLDTGVYRIPDIDGDTFVFRYHVVPLWQLEARSMRSQLGPRGAPFCIAMRGCDEAFVRLLAGDIRADSSMTGDERELTMQLLSLWCRPRFLAPRQRGGSLAWNGS
jgi:hypothetical protein